MKRSKAFYRMNEIISHYKLEHPDATVFRLHAESGIVIFETGAMLKMYNASMELLN